MDSRTLVELITLIGGIITALAGIVNAIRGRKATDEALIKSAGEARVSQAKAAEDLTVNQTYMDQVTEHMATLEAQLSQAMAVLTKHGLQP